MLQLREPKASSRWGQLVKSLRVYSIESDLAVLGLAPSFGFFAVQASPSEDPPRSRRSCASCLEQRMKSPEMCLVSKDPRSVRLGAKPFSIFV